MMLPVDRFLNAIYMWAMHRLHDENDRDKWLAELYAPLPGREAEQTEQAHVAEMDAFAAFAGAFGVDRGPNG